MEAVETMMLKLASVGNPDYGQNPNEPLYTCEPDTEVAVKSFAQASEVCRQFIETNDLGGGNWAGGQIFSGNEQIARVSYNGRIWAVPLRTELLFPEDKL